MIRIWRKVSQSTSRRNGTWFLLGLGKERCPCVTLTTSPPNVAAKQGNISIISPKCLYGITPFNLNNIENSACERKNLMLVYFITSKPEQWQERSFSSASFLLNPENLKTSFSIPFSFLCLHFTFFNLDSFLNSNFNSWTSLSSDPGCVSLEHVVHGGKKTEATSWQEKVTKQNTECIDT